MSDGKYDRFVDEVALDSIRETPLVYGALKLASQTGDIAKRVSDVIKDPEWDEQGELPKTVRDSIVSELGDALWYITFLAGVLDSNLCDLIKTNMSDIRMGNPHQLTR